MSDSSSFPQQSQPSVFSLANNSNLAWVGYHSLIHCLITPGFWLCSLRLSLKTEDTRRVG